MREKNLRSRCRPFGSRLPARVLLGDIATSAFRTGDPMVSRILRDTMRHSMYAHASRSTAAPFDPPNESADGWHPESGFARTAL